MTKKFNDITNSDNNGLSINEGIDSVSNNDTDNSVYSTSIVQRLGVLLKGRGTGFYIWLLLFILGIILSICFITSSHTIVIDASSSNSMFRLSLMLICYSASRYLWLLSTFNILLLLFKDKLGFSKFFYFMSATFIVALILGTMSLFLRW